MSEERWSEVDAYITDLLVQPDEAVTSAVEVSARAGLPPISVSPAHGKLLHLLARIRGAEQILEIGTLGGYSTIWLARALPEGGRLVSLEIDRRHAEIARANLATAGLEARVEVRLGSALESLDALAAEGAGPFDLTFIDADKANNPEYFRAALGLSRLGSVIVVDNVVRNGGVLDEGSRDPDIVGTRRLNEVMAAEPRVSVTEVQTVGVKGYDGFALALVVA